MPRGAFKPAPNVDSAVLRIGSISRAGFEDATEEERFLEVIRAGFAHKRKRLAKNLEEKFSKEMVAGAFGVGARDVNVRSEDLSLETWKALTRELKSS